MCVECCTKYGGDAVEPTHQMLVAVAYIREFYDTYAAGGPLHVVLDDYNIEDEFLRPYVLPEWNIPEDDVAKAHLICEMLRPLSMAQRAAVIGIAHGDRPIEVAS